MKIQGIDRYFEGLSVSTGVVRMPDLAYALTTSDSLTEERVPHTRIHSFYRGQLGDVDLQWTACSATVCKQPQERLIAISETGLVQSLGGGPPREEPRISSERSSPRTRGPLREVRGVADGRAYAVGTARQAYRRDAPGTWVRIDESAQTKDMDPTEVSFESIDGFSETDIYTVGWEGEIWRYDGQVWRRLDSPTNLALHKVRCGSDGRVYACGQTGTLLRGQGDDWELIAPDTTEEDMWGLEWFGGHLYVATLHFVYRLDGTSLTRVDFGDDPPTTCYHLSGVGEVMWSFGAKDIMACEGTTWTRVL